MADNKTGLTLLGEFRHTGAQAAGTIWKPTAQEGYSELDSHQVAEVMYLEITGPVTGAGVEEALDSVYLVLDETSAQEIVNLRGTRSVNMAPKQNLLTDWRYANDEATHNFKACLGIPLINMVKPQFRTRSMLLNATCPKYAKRVRIEAIAGTGGITADYKVRLWGYKYDAKDLARLIGPIGGSEPIIDMIRGKTLMVHKATIPVTEDTWTQLPGGMNQAVPKIMPFVHYAVNAKATTPSTPFDFRYDTGAVNDRVQNLYFAYDQEKKAVLVTHLGVQHTANLQNVWVEIGGERFPQGIDANRPGWLIAADDNYLHFGSMKNLVGEADTPYSYVVPKLEKPFLIHDEKGMIRVQDNGTSVPAGNIMLAVRGVRIEIS